MTRLLAVIALSFLATACQTSRADKPIRMSDRAMQSFANWASYPHAKAFAISANGAAVGMTYCPEFGGCAGDVVGQALAYCESGSKGVPCLIYGMDGQPIVKDARLDAYLAAHPGRQSLPIGRPVN